MAAWSSKGDVKGTDAVTQERDAIRRDAFYVEVAGFTPRGPTTEYEGGLDLLSMAGEISGRVVVESKYGVVYLGATVIAIRGSGGTNLDLTPDEADELSGALSRAAEAAREARAQELLEAKN